MCRIFGFRSVLSSRVNHSLIHAENALRDQSQQHPDGWGVAYYLMGAPHIVKSASTAISDHLFERVSGIVTSQTVIAHLRKATAGDLSIINSHPFQFGKWVFCHNGNIKDFNDIKTELLNEVHPELRHFVLGETDSEIIFFIILSELQKQAPLSSQKLTLKSLHQASHQALQKIIKIAGPFSLEESSLDEINRLQTYLTFLITDGEIMLAHQGGKDLYFSTHKKLCPERESCAFFSKSCENPTQKGNVNHLIFSSEPIENENIWKKMNPGQMIGVDRKMTIHFYEKSQQTKA